MTLIKLNNKIVKCRQCDRLVNFREKIASDKRKQYINENYWGRPITGYGDINSQLLMIGLAPAAHGGIEQVEFLLEINQQIFFSNAFIKLDLQIKVFQYLEMMVWSLIIFI